MFTLPLAAKRLLPILFLVMAWQGAWGQGIVWEKRIGWSSSDELTDVLAVPNGSFIACGISYQFGVQDFRRVPYPAVCLLSIFPSGDTAWFRPLPFYGAGAYLCGGDAKGFYMVAIRSFVPPMNYDSQLFLFKISYQGDVLWQRPVGSLFASAKRLLKTSKGDFVITGWMGAMQGTGNTTDMYVARFDTLGLVHFFERYNTNPRTYGNWIEETPDGTFLASGSAGSRIWAIEIDSNGAEIKRETFFQTPTLQVYDTRAVVNQTPSGMYVASGFASTVGYFGLFSQFTSSSRIWGGEQPVSFLPPHVNDDGSMVVYTSRAGSQRFTKFREDSAQVWNVELRGRLGASGVRVFAIGYSSDSSAVAVGWADYVGSAGRDFYLCRIRNVGVPYNPGPVGIKQKHKGLPPLIAYPNPSSGPLTVHTRSRLPLVVFNLSGQQFMQAQPDGSGTTMLDMRALPPGLYVLRQGESMVKVALHRE